MGERERERRGVRTAQPLCAIAPLVLMTLVCGCSGDVCVYVYVCVVCVCSDVCVCAMMCVCVCSGVCVCGDVCVYV